MVEAKPAISVRWVMLRCALRRGLRQRRHGMRAKAEAISMAMRPKTKLTRSGARGTEGESEGGTDRAEAQIRAAPKRSARLPDRGATRPPISSEKERTPNTHCSDQAKSAAMPGASVPKL